MARVTIDTGDQPLSPSPGREGATATVEADPRRVGAVRTEYAPEKDGDPDPGEIVWTWVPYEENDGRGKDRPVLVVARERAGTLLAVQLTSKDRRGDNDFVAIGTGPWDREERPSWVAVDRVLRVHEDGDAARGVRAGPGPLQPGGAAAARAVRLEVAPRNRRGPGAARSGPLRGEGSSRRQDRVVPAFDRSRTAKTTVSKVVANRAPGAVSSRRKASATSAGSFRKTPQPQAPSTSLRTPWAAATSRTRSARRASAGPTSASARAGSVRRRTPALGAGLVRKPAVRGVSSRAPRSSRKTGTPGAKMTRSE